MLKVKTLKATSINLLCVTFVFIYVNREVTFIKLFSTDYSLGSLVEANRLVEASCCKLNVMSVMFLTIL